MKTILLASLILGLGAIVPPIEAETSTTAPENCYFKVTSVDGIVSAGAPLLSVEFNLGQPQQRIGGRYWLYAHYGPKREDARGAIDSACDWLVVEHDGNQVVSLALADLPTIARMTAATDALEATTALSQR